jgi:ferredoxin-NADP reductase
MIRDAAGRGLSRDLRLFYGNRSPDDAAYLSELRELAQHDHRFRLVATMDEAGSATWAGERGRIGSDMIERHVGDVAAPVYYVAGPPAMVAAVEASLQELGVPAESVRTEEFAGY